MKLEVLETTGALAERGADVLAQELRAAVGDRGRATLAVSGGSTPGDLLAALASRDLPWDHVHLVQVDERIAPDGHPDRNLELLRTCFLAQRSLPAEHVHAMPVTATDLAAAAARYVDVLIRLAGYPPVLDVVQLGLGSDGHTASLVPDDPVLDVVDQDVAVTGTYEGRRRLTCTVPLLARARRRLWLVSGAAKAPALARVLAGDLTQPAARLPQRDALWLVDRAAASQLTPPDDPTDQEERP